MRPNRSCVPLALVLAACSTAVADPPPEPSHPQGTPQAPVSAEPELGALGFQPPEVADIRLAEVVVHQDTTGGQPQQLLGLTGSAGAGFTAVWRDQRDGMLGLYFARLGPDGHELEPERPLYAQPGTVRRLDPAAAVAADGSGAVAWVSMQDGSLRAWIRTFGADGQFRGGDAIVPDSVGAPARDRGPAQGRDAKREGGREARDPRSLGARTPALVVRPDGPPSMVWVAGDRLRAADFDVGGTALRPPYEVGPAGTEPEPGLWALGDATGRLAVAWNGKAGAHFVLRLGDRQQHVGPLEGRARGLAADPSGGYWLLLLRGDAPVLQHLDARGAVEGPARTPVPGPVRTADLAAYAGGVALLVARGEAPPPPARGGDRGAQRDAGGRDAGGRGGRGAGAVTGSVELWLLDAAGAPAGDRLIVPSAEARDVGEARVASNGARLLVAWTDSREGDPDIWARLVDPAASADARLGPEMRVNADTASADQINPDVDASGARGVVTWQDRRSGRSRIYARRFGTAGLDGDEVALPLAVDGAEPAGLAGGSERPAVGVRPDGRALVVWKQDEGTRGRILAQVLTAEGGAGSALLEVDARDGDAIQAPAVCALQGARGWAVVWPRGGAEGIWARRVGPDGALEGPARRVSEPGDAALTDAACALLDDGRVLAAWTSHRAGAPREQGWTIRARFLDADGAAKGAELAFEASRRQQDWDPSVAPAAGGGFVLSWTSGFPGDLTRDVVVRRFDAQGRAVGPTWTPCYLANEQDFSDVTRLADGSFAVAWEDDVSYFDQVYVRRLLADGRGLGPWMRIDSLETTFVPDRVAPRIAAIGDGFAAVFADRRRSRGLDVRLKLVGPRFDPASGN